MTSVQIPVLETSRLVLRGHTRADLPDCVEMWSNPAVSRFIGGRSFSPEEVWARLLRYVGHWSLVGFGYWLVCEKHSGEFVGEVGFGDFQRDLVPSLAGAPEIGWVVSPHARRRGYALEAIHAAHRWLEQGCGAKRTVCMIDHDNTLSLHIAARCGYRTWADTPYHGTPVFLLERSASKGRSAVLRSPKLSLARSD